MWTEANLQEALVNPIYVYHKVTSAKTWLAVQHNLIKEMGEEQYLQLLLNIVLGDFNLLDYKG